jgi:S1/P1 Nuclease
MRRICSLLLFALLFIGFQVPKEAKAWGEFGHLTVCDLSYRNLTPTSREALKQLFNSDGGGIRVGATADREGRHYTSFNVGCLEEDTRPRMHPKDHFINVARDTVAITGGTCPISTITGQPAQCVFAGIERDLAILKDTRKTNQERVIALMAVGHWVGDIHQPLHISFKDDIGGNDINVSTSGRCGTSTYRPGNLHAVWDNCLLESGLFEKVRQRANYRASWGERTITYRAVDTLLANTSLAEERTFVQTAPWEWAAESFEITRHADAQYCVLVGATCQYSATQVTLNEGAAKKVVRIDAAYRNAFKDVAEERVRRAGFRLAHLINLALDPAYTNPT